MNLKVREDRYFMRKVLALARKGGAEVRPNPRVGAVLVKRGRILASAYHSRFGGPHAEAKVLRQAAARVAGATLYVNLEPCSIYGKTPPCVDEIIRRKLSRVVMGCLDYNPATTNRAARILRRAGISVTSGVLEAECFDLNRDFFTWITKNRPYTVLKLALSLDGKIATRTGHARWISSAPSRRFSHFLRSQADGVLVGINTVLSDDPRLTVRMGYRNPGLKKIVLDSRGRIPLSARLFQGRGHANTIVVTTPRMALAKRRQLDRAGVKYFQLRAKGDRVSLKTLFPKLAGEGMIRLLIEGGGEVAASALSDQLIDEVHILIAPIIIGGKAAPAAVGGKGIGKIQNAHRLVDVKVENLGSDIHITGHLKYGGKKKGGK